MVDSLSLNQFDAPIQLESPRKFFWVRILEKCADSCCNEMELSMLQRLAAGDRWMDMIPVEWKEIYGALYDEAQCFNIAETEKIKIDKDVHRTFGLFTRTSTSARVRLRVKETEYYDSLHAVLLAASHERGYCQGINFLAAAFLLSEESERHSFTILCFLLRHRNLDILFNSKCSSLVEYMKIFEKKLRRHNMAVYKYLKSIGFGAVCYAIEWFTTCFIVMCPGDISSCVIDLLLIGFDDIMIKVGLAIMDLLESKILPLELEELQTSFKALVTDLEPMSVISRALSIALDGRQRILQTMAKNIEHMSPHGEFVDTLRSEQDHSRISSDEQSTAESDSGEYLVVEGDDEHSAMGIETTLQKLAEGRAAQGGEVKGRNEKSRISRHKSTNTNIKRSTQRRRKHTGAKGPTTAVQSLHSVTNSRHDSALTGTAATTPLFSLWHARDHPRSRTDVHQQSKGKGCPLPPLGFKVRAVSVYAGGSDDSDCPLAEQQEAYSFLSLWGGIFSAATGTQQTLLPALKSALFSNMLSHDHDQLSEDEYAQKMALSISLESDLVPKTTDHLAQERLKRRNRYLKRKRRQARREVSEAKRAQAALAKSENASLMSTASLPAGLCRVPEADDSLHAGDCDGGSTPLSTGSNSAYNDLQQQQQQQQVGDDDPLRSSVRPTLTNSIGSSFFSAAVVCPMSHDKTGKAAQHQRKEAKEDSSLTPPVPAAEIPKENGKWVSSVLSNILQTSIWVSSLGLLGKQQLVSPFPEDSTDLDSEKSLKKFNKTAEGAKKSKARARSRARERARQAKQAAERVALMGGDESALLAVTWLGQSDSSDDTDMRAAVRFAMPSIASSEAQQLADDQVHMMLPHDSARTELGGELGGGHCAGKNLCSALAETNL